ncbi:MAG: 5'-methylthioadenosine/adenosylhomocysteine nucleosidase [Phycisphaerales bacterium]|nr:5'-methylthioadenosine/adenosylhomocysteine nucleosidase [Phycisphaerales bacterium]
MTIGLMSAMPQEADALVARLDSPSVHQRAGRRFIHASCHGVPIVVVFSRWGKVAAASTATELIVAHGVDRLVFSGVAGSLRPEVSIGDVVIATELVQHDLDASPFFPPRVVPLLEIERLPTDATMSDDLALASRDFLRDESPRAWENLTGRSQSNTLHRGVIATGDRVIASHDARLAINAAVPDALCVEMEGAAVAQVCFEHAVPFACVRTISDSADHHVEACVASFIAGLASAYTAGIVGRWARAL